MNEQHACESEDADEEQVVHSLTRIVDIVEVHASYVQPSYGSCERLYDSCERWCDLAKRLEHET